MTDTPRKRGRPRKIAPEPEIIRTRTDSAVESGSLIDDIIGIVRDMIPITDDHARKIEREIRFRHGGQRLYLGTHARDDHSDRDRRIRAAYQSGERVQYLARAYGLTAARVYQIVSGHYQTD